LFVPTDFAGNPPFFERTLAFSYRVVSSFLCIGPQLPYWIPVCRRRWIVLCVHAYKAKRKEIVIVRFAAEFYSY